MFKVLGTNKNSIKNNELFTYFVQNKLAIIFSIILLVGMVIGATSIERITFDDLKKLEFLFMSNFKERNLQSNFTIFASSFSSIFIFVIAIIIVSLSFFGTICIPCVVFFRGIGIGLTAGYLYAIYKLKGIGYHLLILLPGIFISSIALILIATRGFKFSEKLINKFLPNANDDKLWPKLLSYLTKVFKYMIILLISSLLDTLTMMLFSRFFTF